MGLRPGEKCHEVLLGADEVDNRPMHPLISHVAVPPLPIGLLAAFRNVGVIMAALGASLPDLAWFYFAMVQFPIFLLPHLLKPLARRLQQPNA